MSGCDTRAEQGTREMKQTAPGMASRACCDRACASSDSFLGRARAAWGDGLGWEAAVDELLQAVEEDPSSRRAALGVLARASLQSLPLIRLCEQIEATTGRIAFFGLTDVARSLIAEFDDRELLYIIDSNPAMQGRRIDGVEVVSIDDARRNPPDVAVITSTSSRDAMRAQLRSCPELASAHVLPVEGLCEQLEATTGRIGLVGLTPLARQLVRQYRGREIACVIDEAHEGEKIDGVPVVGYEHAAADPPDVLVLASQDAPDTLVDAVRSHRGLCRCVLVPKIADQHSTLRGDRDVEWSWVVGKMPPGPGAALDLGCASTWMGLAATRRGYDVTAIDLKPARWLYTHPGLRFVQGDLLKLDLAPASFNLIINCSTVEHIGLEERHGSPERPDGDLEAMARLRELTKPGGTMLLTIPVGVDEVVFPLHRIYGRERLPRLLAGWDVEEREFWVKNERNQWQRCAGDEALDQRAQHGVFALGCFVLRRSVGE